MNFKRNPIFERCVTRIRQSCPTCPRRRYEPVIVYHYQNRLIPRHHGLRTFLTTVQYESCLDKRIRNSGIERRHSPTGNGGPRLGGTRSDIRPDSVLRIHPKYARRRSAFRVHFGYNSLTNSGNANANACVRAYQKRPARHARLETAQPFGPHGPPNCIIQNSTIVLSAYSLSTVQEMDARPEITKYPGGDRCSRRPKLLYSHDGLSVSYRIVYFPIVNR